MKRLAVRTLVLSESFGPASVLAEAVCGADAAHRASDNFVPAIRRPSLEPSGDDAVVHGARGGEGLDQAPSTAVDREPASAG